ncbi:MFS transporter [Aquabacter sp. CN5-332]|uniref:MFS transporter n=1 Tax=Aquabacter sp. CN5-332 TaxID=3156608 RepID=UPI0032B342F7
MAAIDTSGAKNQGAGSKITFAVGIAVLVMILSYCVNAMDRTIFPLILSDVRKEFGFNLQDAGLMSTVFTFGMAIAGLPTGYLMSRLSRKSVMQVGILIYSLATIVTIWATGFADMLFYRAVSGVGEAMQLTALLAIFSSYFQNNRAAAVGTLNIAYAVGAIVGPALGTTLWTGYGNWRAPMVWFGIIGLVMMVFIALVVRPWLSEANAAPSAGAKRTTGGATTLRNPNTVVLAVLAVVLGFALYGFLGMYPTFLREQLHFAPQDIGRVMSFYGLGALVSVGAGWLGDRFSPRVVLPLSYLFGAGVCALLFNGPTAFVAQAAFSFALGMAFSGMIFVNLVGYSVKAVSGELAGRASGIFVTCLYGAATVAGYLIGWLAGQVGWVTAGNTQLVGLCIVGAAISLLISPSKMARPAA